MSCRYIGIIDCEGLDSFFSLDPTTELLDAFIERRQPKNPAGERLFYLDMRARFNSQRHPVVYAADISEDNARHVQSLLENGEPVLAAKILIGTADRIGFSRGTKHDWGKLRKLVPEFSKFGDLSKEMFGIDT